MDIFEGSRRLMQVARVLWIGLVLFEGFELANEPGSFIHEGVRDDGTQFGAFCYETDYPNQTFRRFFPGKEPPGRECDIFKRDLEESSYEKAVNYDLGGGYKTEIDLWFNSSRTDQGARMIPIRMDADGRWEGAFVWNPAVEAYATERANSFVLPPDDKAAAIADVDVLRYRCIKSAVFYTIGVGFGGIILSFLLQVGVGYVARGYLGRRAA